MVEGKLIARIKRVKGQVEGIERMMENKRSCLEIVQQIAAAKSALAKIASKMLAEESCLIDKKKEPLKFKKIVEQLVKSI